MIDYGTDDYYFDPHEIINTKNQDMDQVQKLTIIDLKKQLEQVINDIDMALSGHPIHGQELNHMVC